MLLKQPTLYAVSGVTRHDSSSDTPEWNPMLDSPTRTDRRFSLELLHGLFHHHFSMLYCIVMNYKMSALRSQVFFMQYIIYWLFVP